MNAMTGVHRRKFIADYKPEAAHLVLDTGRVISDGAREIDVSPQVRLMTTLPVVKE